jgi:hypothetical protein
VLLVMSGLWPMAVVYMISLGAALYVDV